MNSNPRHFSDLSPAVRAIWAKSGEPPGHALLAHMLDVAAVAEALVRREPTLTQAWAAFRPLLDTDGDTDMLIRRVLGASAASIRACPLQQIADRPLDQANGPTLMIVEAPMGEGKTELAFLAYLRLQAANSHRGLYVALPTTLLPRRCRLPRWTRRPRLRSARTRACGSACAVLASGTRAEELPAR